MNEMKLHESALLGERYYSTHHKSGLPILVFPKKMSTTYAMIAVRFGSVDNAADETGERLFSDGVAHFLEHKLFSNEDGSDSFERFAALGADANAYTSHSRTVYLFSCTERFEESLAELLTFTTHPYFTDETVEKEQGIIAEEIRMCRDDPYDRCYRNMIMGLYEKHPVRIDICGSERAIMGITAKELYEVYHTYYTLPNMALVVCGDVDPARVLAVADACLPQMPDDRMPPQHTVRESSRVAVPHTVARGQVGKPIFAIGIKDVHIPREADACTRRCAVMEILSEMIFGDTGELYNRLFDAGLISPEFSFGYTLTRDFGFLRISGEANEPTRVLEEIYAYLAELAQRGLDPEEFEHCRRIEFAEYIKGFDSTEEIADNLVAYHFEGAELFSYADVIRDVTFEEAVALFDEFFDPECFTLSEVRPQQEGGSHD